MKYGICLLLLALSAAPEYAAGTASWEMNSYQDFLVGRFSGVSLSRDGRLLLAPRVETLFSSGQPVIWSIVRASDGSIYAGTGHRGQIYRIERSGKSSLLWTADQPEVFALALDNNGLLYVATSPKGKVYRMEDGKAKEFFSPDSIYIWALAFGKDGALYIGTGNQGKIFRVDPSGKGEVYYATGQSHVTSLGFDLQGRLLAGTEPNGILYRISAKDKAFVLYDADLPEIRAITTTPDGMIYAAAQGGGSIGRTPAGTAPARGSATPQATVSTTVTVTDDVQGGIEIKPKPEAAKPAVPAAGQVTASVSPVTEVAGVEKSAVYRIAPDNTVETLWSSKEENVYDVLAVGKDLIFSTDGRGRVYRLGPDRKVTLLIQTDEGETTRLIEDPRGLLAATGDLGKVLSLGEGPGTSGLYEAAVHDAGKVARWGRLSWRAETGEGRRLVFFTRSGNSLRPDKTWSDWSGPLTDANGSAVPSPNARYIQWKAEFSGSAGRTPVLDGATLAYLPQNSAPVLKSIQASLQTSASTSAAKQAVSQAASSAFSITVTDTGEPPPITSSGTPTQTLARPAGRQLQITWQAEDADNDRLVYTLYFRGEDEKEWKLIKSDLYQNSYQIDGDALADGRYFFRVKVSDLPSNPPDSAREAELVSAPVLIDNTPPVVKAGAPRWVGGRVEIEFTAEDAASPLRRAEYSVDAGHWTPLQAVDGVIDSPRESFIVRLEQLSPGEHLVVVRVYDSADNAGLAKVVLR